MKANKKEDRKVTISETTDPLKEYLTYYKNLTTPGFAVMLTGDWGSGKTYQITKQLAKSEHYYVSVFGLSSIEEIYAQLLEQMYPADKKARKESAFWSEIKSVMGIPIGPVFSAAINKTLKTKIKDSRIIVFDDFERCLIKMPKLLGFINSLVEHENCKVVIVANDEKIAAQFAHAKEKVIGHTIHIQPQTDDAYEHFLELMEPRATAILTTHKSSILNLFRLSGCKSLRILRYVMNHVGRLCATLTADQLKNDRAMLSLLELFVAIAIEVQRGFLNRASVLNRTSDYGVLRELRSHSQAVAGDHRKAETNSAFEASYDRFIPAVDIGSLVLSNELLVETVIDGVFNKTAVQAYLESTGHFAAPKDQPAWRRFMQFDSLSDSETDELIATMDRQFQNREVLSIGELMHIWSFRIMRVKENLLSSNKETEVKAMKEYFDDLVSNSTFPLKLGRDLFGGFAGYGGYTYWGAEENALEIKEIYQHGKLCEQKALEKSAPIFRERLVRVMKTSPEMLVRLLTYEDNQPGEYQDTPVLTSIDPIEFVKQMLELPRASWRIIRDALVARRKIVRGNTLLKDEVDWFARLDAEIQASAVKARGSMNSVRIRRLVPYIN